MGKNRRSHGRPALSFWQDSAPSRPQPRPSLDTGIQADVAIIGAGYTGLWTAYYLRKANPGLNVVVLEAETAGFGASGRNGGWCSAYLSGISHWLENPVHREGGIRLQKLMFETIPEIGRTVAAESIDCHFEQSGALEIAVIPQQLERLKKDTEALWDLGFSEDDYRLLDATGIRNTLNVDRALGAVHMKHCASVHPARLARGLADTVERLGVTVYEKSPVLEVSPHRAATASAAVEADNVIVATEGYSRTIQGLGKRLIPLHSMMVVTEPLTASQVDEIRFNRRYCFGNLDRLVTYGHLTADNRIAFGCRGSYQYGSAIRTFYTDDDEFTVVRETLLRFFPGLHGIRFTHAWGGCMGVSRSLRPSVVFDRASGMGWAGGYFGNGVGASHLAARTLADLVLGNDTERVTMPWVNPPDEPRRWEPEPLRWLGIRSRARLMRLADRAEYRGSPLAPVYRKTLENLFP